MSKEKETRVARPDAKCQTCGAAYVWWAGHVCPKVSFSNESLHAAVDGFIKQSKPTTEVLGAFINALRYMSESARGRGQCKAQFIDHEGRTWVCTAIHDGQPNSWYPFGGHRWEKSQTAKVRPYFATICPKCNQAKLAQTDCKTCGYLSVRKYPVNDQSTNAPPETWVTNFEGDPRNKDIKLHERCDDCGEGHLAGCSNHLENKKE